MGQWIDRFIGTEHEPGRLVQKFDAMRVWCRIILVAIGHCARARFTGGLVCFCNGARGVPCPLRRGLPFLDCIRCTRVPLGSPKQAIRPPSFFLGTRGARVANSAWLTSCAKRELVSRRRGERFSGRIFSTVVRLLGPKRSANWRCRVMISVED